MHGRAANYFAIDISLKMAFFPREEYLIMEMQNLLFFLCIFNKILTKIYKRCFYRYWKTQLFWTLADVIKGTIFKDKLHAFCLIIGTAESTVMLVW